VKQKIVFRIFASYLIIIFLSFFVLNIYIKDELKQVLTDNIERKLITYAKLIDLSSPQQIAAQLDYVAGVSEARVTLIDAQGRVFADSDKDDIEKMENHLDRPELQEARLRGYGKATRISRTKGVEMFYIALAVEKESEIIGYVRLSRKLDDVQSTVADVYSSFLIALIITGIGALIMAGIFAYRLARPIKIIEKYTERMRRENTAGTIMLKTSDETKKLADNINYLVEELQEKIKAANEEKSKLMAALTSINEGILILDAGGRIEFISPALDGLLSEHLGNTMGKTLMEAFRNVELHKAFQKYKSEGSNISTEITLGNVEPVIMRVTISEIRDYPGEEKVMVVFHDITRLKKLEIIRTDFVANVTHEIRTPLTAIIGYLETIKSDRVKKAEDIKKFVDIMLKQAERLNRLVEDLMTISKIELGETNFKHEDIDLAEVIGGVIPLFETKASEKNIKIINELPQNTITISGDKDRLMQIFVNLLDNAVKFNLDDGTVTINATEEKEGVIINIIDTGAGIPKEEIQRLGERFYRVDKTRSRDLGGTGLGLSIVKHLMIAHGGRMEIKSEISKGTVVSLFFPCKNMQ